MKWLKAKETKVEDEEIKKDLSNLGDKLQAKLIAFNTLTQSFIDNADDLAIMAKSGKVDKKKVENAIKDSKTIYSQIQDITPMLNKLETLS